MHHHDSQNGLFSSVRCATNVAFFSDTAVTIRRWLGHERLWHTIELLEGTLPMSTVADSVGQELKSILIFLGVIWAVFLASYILPLDDYGLKPRSAVGLVGIVTMPFLHADLGHIVGNTVPLFVLLLLLAGSRAKSWQIVVEIVLLGGALLWVLGRSTNGAGATANHIGASGLVSGLIAFLILGGVFERRPIPSSWHSSHSCSMVAHCCGV